jgi:hypothetical protein
VWETPPDRWFKALDLASNRPFYFNLRSQQSTWCRPDADGYESDPSTPGTTDESISSSKFLVERFSEGSGNTAFSEWSPSFDPFSNRVFWSNPKTQRAQWHKPMDCKHILPDSESRRSAYAAANRYRSSAASHKHKRNSHRIHNSKPDSARSRTGSSGSDARSGSTPTALATAAAALEALPDSVRGTPVEHLAKSLNAQVVAAVEENQKLKAVQRQLAMEAESRLRVVSELQPGSFAQEGNIVKEPGRMGRHLETSLRPRERGSYRPSRTIR